MSVLAYKAREERGFTLVEVLAATVILLVGIFGMVALIDGANQATAASQNRAAANNLARQIVDTAREIPYSAVTSTGVAAALQSQPGLADADPVTPGWQIIEHVRPSDPTSATLTFTVTVSACSVDDSKDTTNDSTTHDSSLNWCSGSLTTDDDYKRFSVTVTPPSGSGITDPVTMTAIIANSRLDGSQAVGIGSGSALIMSPLCTGCSQSAWSNYNNVAPCQTFTTTVGTDKCAPTYNGAAGTNYTGNQITSVPFKSIWAKAPASVNFYLDDWSTNVYSWPTSTAAVETLLGSATQDPSSNRVWNYTWTLANTYPNQTPDGYYSVKAVAYDSSNNQIDQQQLAFWLNRFSPDLKAWGTPNAGRDCLFPTSASACSSGTPGNFTLHYPEIEWYQSTPAACNCRIDHDFFNFKVYRTGTSTAVCNSPGSTTGISFISYWWPNYNTAPPYGNRNSNSACEDTSAPTSGTVTYTLKVTNYGPDGLSTIEGDDVQAASANVNPATQDLRPNSPTGFSAAWFKDGSGNWQINFTWTNPSGRGDPDAAPDCITSYRIYAANATTETTPAADTERGWRSTGGVASPSPCSSTAVTSFATNESTNSGGVTNNATTKYFITAVDSHMNESTPVAFTLSPHA
ncbi:MAG: prepilin-type N-terminal cleavage/methylation domain-containing protein [Actinobacteria bacterium]|nr:prepilin-type N-terminal cleavage/methylation domain-containing protein [Actinomycetota bacterium]